MKKINLLIILLSSSAYIFADDCPPSMLELCDYTHGTFYHLDNQLGVNALGSYTNATFTNSQNNAGSGGVGAEVYWDFLMSNGLWFSNKVDYSYYMGNSSFANDQANYNLKFGYGWQPIYDYWIITPYIVGLVGAGQLEWDSQMNYGIGAGLRTEVAMTTRNSLYADYNWQYLLDFGNFSTAYNQQFGTSNAALTGTPYSQVVELGYKHVFNCNWNMQVFYRYSANDINFTFNNAATNQNYSNSSNMIGLGVSWYMGG